MTDFTPILNLTLHIIMLLPKNKCKKKKESLSGCHLFFFATSICIQGMHFHPTARKLYLNKLTLTVCLRNARTTYFFFQKRLLTTFPGRAERRKRKKNPKQPEEKAIPSGHDVKITSYWHQCDVVTSHWRQYDVILTSYTCWNVIKKSQSPTAHDVLLTSMRRDLRRIDVDTTSFCHSNCLPCLSKQGSQLEGPSPPLSS